MRDLLYQDDVTTKRCKELENSRKPVLKTIKNFYASWD